MANQARRLQKRIEPHLAALRRAAYRLCRNVPDAEDLVQAVCLRAFERPDEVLALRSPRAWLLRVELNLYVDGVRRESRAVTESFDILDDDAPALVDEAFGPEERADTDRRIASLTRAWPALSRDQRALLALYAEGYSLKEIGEITELPLSALKARLHRARVRLGKLLTQETTHCKPAGLIGEVR